MVGPMCEMFARMKMNAPKGDQIMRTSLLFLGLIFAFGPAGTAHAAKPVPAPPPGPTRITACQDITQTGPYLLVNNLTVTNDDCLRVSADNVEIDLGGFGISMTGGPSTNTAGIRNIDSGAGFANGLSVRNGAITGFSSGIRIDGGAGHRIEGVRISENTVDGIGITGAFDETGTGVANVIKNNVVVRNGTANGGVGGIIVRCPAIVAGNLAVENGPNAATAEQIIVDGCQSDTIGFPDRSFFCTLVDNQPVISVTSLPNCNLLP